MTTIVVNDFIDNSVRPGMLLRVDSGYAEQSYIITSIDSNTLTVWPWNWMTRILMWNPCNKLGDLYG